MHHVTETRQKMNQVGVSTCRVHSCSRTSTTTTATTTTMALKAAPSVASLTRQISELDISSKLDKPARQLGGTSLHKSASQTQMSKLLTKYAAPHPHTQNSSATTMSKLAAMASQSQLSKQETSTGPPSPGRGATKQGIDIGHYDGGLELDNEKRGSQVFGEAAEDLALDSSLSKYVHHTVPSGRFLMSHHRTEHGRRANGACTRSK